MSSATAKQSVAVSTTPEKLYDFVSEAKRATTFIPGLTRIENVNPQQAAVGQTWTYEFDWFGVVFKGNSKCTAAQRPSRYGFQTLTGNPSTWTYSFDPEGKGETRLTLEVQYNVPEQMVAKFASQGTLEKMNLDRAREIVNNIKTMIEG
jgi:ribosome-associated toxin RatA of RatAB toxin-antitoxin module